MSLSAKYRPMVLADYVASTKTLENTIRMYLDRTTDLPLLLHGPAGGGKTLLANLLPYALCPDFQPADQYTIDATIDRSINKIRAAKSFCETFRLNSDNFSAVVIDEFDRLTSEAMDALKNLLQLYLNVPDMRVQFILTTNFLTQIPEPVRDRCHVVKVSPPAADMLVDTAMKILAAEGKRYERTLIATILNTNTRAGTLSYREFYKRLERLIAH